MRTYQTLLIALLAPPAFVAGALRFGHDPVVAEANAPLIHREQGYVGSSACATCHPDHHESWQRTFHSTMTQRATAASVQGAFDGRTVRYGRDSARPFRDGERFCMEVPDEGGGRRNATVELTVGSRRYQQYFERVEQDGFANYVRLPILWHNALQRWLPLETVFLGQDTEGLGNHAAVWNANCIFCHNTGPRPGLQDVRSFAGSPEMAHFDSAVGELGIACETCHGPGAVHAAQERDPLVRYVGGPAPAIVDPLRLDQERAVAICGQCHGARLPSPWSRLDAWMTTGPTFRAGDQLTEHVTPIRRDTPVRGKTDPEAFSLRFWGDGTARLTAYEYQGITDSKCYRGGSMTCQSCHAMHAGDPRGQLRPDRPGNELCTQCHAAVARDVRAHTHHDPGGAGSSCVACHMPKIVYGILDVHRSHHIDNPDPARDAAAGRPHACTLCHLDRNLGWVAESMQRWWGARYVAPATRADGAPLELADAAANLFAGDAAARAVAANACGEPTAVFGHDYDAALRAWLAVTMGDGYPSVRFLARRSLLALEARAPLGLDELLRSIDHTAGAEQRGRDVFGLLDAIAARARGRAAVPATASLIGADFRLDVRAVVRLTDLQGRNLISIGE
ncbi:MAG TPA: cytochrome c3 family protein [Planctomycetota bacterium]|nr:cytochrome c3 family protein [Planctomycetota bacterium]